MHLHPLSRSLPLVLAKEPSSPARAPAKPRPPSVSFSPPSHLTSGARQSATQYAREAVRVVAPWGFTPSMSPPSLFYLNSNSTNFQIAWNSYNSSTISPNELILFALCSLQRNLAAHQKWDFSDLSRICGDFQKSSWYFLLVLKFIFRGWGLSWGSPEGLWTSSALRQATTTFSWCHFNIDDFLTWMKWLIHAFK